MAFSFPAETANLLDLFSFVSWTSIGLIMISLIILRRKKKDTKRTFKVQDRVTKIAFLSEYFWCRLARRITMHDSDIFFSTSKFINFRQCYSQLKTSWFLPFVFNADEHLSWQKFGVNVVGVSECPGSQKYPWGLLTWTIVEWKVPCVRYSQQHTIQVQ